MEVQGLVKLTCQKCRWHYLLVKLICLEYDMIQLLSQMEPPSYVGVASDLPAAATTPRSATSTTPSPTPGSSRGPCQSPRTSAEMIPIPDLIPYSIQIRGMYCITYWGRKYYFPWVAWNWVINLRFVHLLQAGECKLITKFHATHGK